MNVAARMQELADPGGICISRTVFTHVKGKLDLEFEHLGERRVKNIVEPVSVYRVVLDEKAHALASTSLEPATAARPRRGRLANMATGMATGIASLTVILAAAVWLLWPEMGQNPDSAEPLVGEPNDGPSLAVLPFKTLGADLEQFYFADGIADDIITDLSNVSGLFVIARNSSFAYRADEAEPLAAARELGVSHILDGSVRREGDRVRINAQLIDADSGGHLWAKRYDRALQDIFAVQDEITGSIVSALAVELTQADKERIARQGTDNVRAYEAFLRGWDHYQKFTRDDIRLARPYFEKAVQLDPKYGRAFAALARLYDQAWIRGWSVELGWDDARCQIERYLELAKQEPTSLMHMVAANKRLMEQRYDEAIDEIGRGLALDPNNAILLAMKGWILTLAGQPEEGLRAAQRAMRLDPGNLARKKWMAGLALLSLERYEEALAAFRVARESNPHLAAWPQVATLVRLDRLDEAETTLLDYMRLRGWSDGEDARQAFRDIETLPWASINGLLNYYPFRRHDDVEQFGGALVELGMCCAEELEHRKERLRNQGHARSAAAERHLESLRTGGMETCVSSG